MEFRYPQAEEAARPKPLNVETFIVRAGEAFKPTPNEKKDIDEGLRKLAALNTAFTNANPQDNERAGGLRREANRLGEELYTDPKPNTLRDLMLCEILIANCSGIFDRWLTRGEDIMRGIDKNFTTAALRLLDVAEQDFQKQAEGIRAAAQSYSEATGDLTAIAANEGRISATTAAFEQWRERVRSGAALHLLQTAGAVDD